MNRPKLPKQLEASILLQSRRRCCVCFGLNRDTAVKPGQIAHLDRDRENNRPDNLVFLCLEHHDEYDSRTSQRKNFTAAEVKVLRAELQEALAAAFRAPLVLTPKVTQGPSSWAGLYRWEHDNASAEIELVDVGQELYLHGMAFWGTTSPGGPNTGELEARAIPWGDQLRIEEGDFTLTIRRVPGGVEAVERSVGARLFGMNVSFQGTYRRVPEGAAALPQAPLRPFESEFWPEEGRPVFLARIAALDLHSRPTADSPLVGQVLVEPGQQVEFESFRYRTLRPGTVLVKADASITGTNLGTIDYVSEANYYHDGGEEVTVQLSAGGELEYLQYRAEGSGFVRWQGLVLAVHELPWLFSSKVFALVTSPVAESWVRIQNAGRDGSGWVLADEQLIDSAREF